MKIIAVICMIIDHIEAVFDGTPQIFRYIGRIVFPIFAFSVAEGCVHTKNRDRYMIRLGLFALISEIPFDLAFGEYNGVSGEISFLDATNVFYTLFLAVAMINMYEKIMLKQKRIPFYILLAAFIVAMCAVLFTTAKGIHGFIVLVIYTISLFLLSYLLPTQDNEKHVDTLPQIKALTIHMLSFLPVVPLLFLSDMLDTDYGMFGVSLIIILYLVRGKRNKLIAAAIMLLVNDGIPIITNTIFHVFGNYISFGFSLLSLFFIYLYNGQRGKNIKWAFYWAYPVHILLIAVIHNFI